MFWLSFRLALVCLSQQFSWSMWIDAVTSSIKFKQYTSHTGLKYQHVAMILTSTMVNYLQCGNEMSFFSTISVNIHCHFNLEKMLSLYVNIANLIVYLVHLQTVHMIFLKQICSYLLQSLPGLCLAAAGGLTAYPRFLAALDTPKACSKAFGFPCLAFSRYF